MFVEPALPQIAHLIPGSSGWAGVVVLPGTSEKVQGYAGIREFMAYYLEGLLVRGHVCRRQVQG